ncbi:MULTISPECIES: SIR2 family protein [Burkholderia]|uniref:SIR2 family protein n=1 Tax=Burkholderia TaxID=32008 RepID=UPI0015C6850E|nr:MULTISPECIES: SIR2 family protein [Burkholderia]
MEETAVNRLVRFFEESKRPILFVGAGVSAAAGVPIWGQLLNTLAEWLRPKDALTANKIIELVRTGDFLRAAEFFYLSDATDAERYKVLLDNLKPTNPAAVNPLCALPVKGALTTNFDRLLNDGFAATKHLAALDFRRGDPSFQQTLWTEELFVSRIHGFVESPQTIILSKSDFGKLAEDTTYKDVLTHFATRSNLLFVGFSFADPAIDSILTDINRIYGPLTQGAHLAIVPSDLSSETASKLRRLNVEQLTYTHESSDRTHVNLWTLLAETNRALTAPSSVTADVSTSPALFGTAKRYLASCYARLNLGTQITPLRDAVIEGTVSAIIQGEAPKAVLVSDIVDAIHRDFGISKHEATEVVQNCLKALSDERLCNWHRKADNPTVAWNGKADDENRLDNAIASLVRSATDRAVVQEGLRITEATNEILVNFFKHLVLQRGWDLGAAFAAGRTPEDANVNRQMFAIAGAKLSTMDTQALVRVCETMLNSPTEREAKILSELGRASFALELALKAPHSHFFHADVLPRKIYLDANVLMPAFTRGHPLNTVYEDMLGRLGVAASKVGGARICTTTGYLNEVISHRRLAIEEYEANTEFFADDLNREAIFFGSANINVFKGAFANFVLNNKSITFPEFIREYAPYTDENQLAKWLHARGVLTVKNFASDGLDVASMTVELQKQYGQDLTQRKNVMLIDHDALQLAALRRDIEIGDRVVFVTADKRLREILAAGPYKHVAAYMISHVGLTQLIDLLVGIDGNERGLAHLMWGARVSEKANEIRQYFTARCLQSYDEAMAMELPALVEEFADRVLAEARRQGVPLDNGHREIFTIAGSFEDQFFEAMREKIETREQANKFR